MIIFLGFIQDSKVNTPHFYFAWDFLIFTGKGGEGLRKKESWVASKYSLQEEWDIPCPTYIPYEERKKWGTKSEA